jgi:hypothetical protein
MTPHHISLLGKLLTGILPPTILAWLALSRGKAKVDAVGTAVLAYPAAWKVLIGILMLAPIGIAVLAMFEPPRADQWWIPWAMIGGFFGLILPLAAEVFFRVVEVGTEGLLSRSPWTGRVSVPWEMVTAVAWSEAMQWFVVKCGDGRKIRVSWYLSGLDELRRALETHAPRVALPPALLPRARR